MENLNDYINSTVKGINEKIDGSKFLNNVDDCARDTHIQYEAIFSDNLLLEKVYGFHYAIWKKRFKLNEIKGKVTKEEFLKHTADVMLLQEELEYAKTKYEINEILNFSNEMGIPLKDAVKSIMLNENFFKGLESKYMEEVSEFVNIFSDIKYNKLDSATIITNLNNVEVIESAKSNKVGITLLENLDGVHKKSWASIKLFLKDGDKYQKKVGMNQLLVSTVLNNFTYKYKEKGQCIGYVADVDIVNKSFVNENTVAEQAISYMFTKNVSAEMGIILNDTEREQQMVKIVEENISSLVPFQKSEEADNLNNQLYELVIKQYDAGLEM